MFFFHSSNLSFDNGNLAYVENDASRVTRTNNTEQYIIYKAKNMIDFTAKVYYYGSITDKIKAYCFADGSNWTLINIASDTPSQTLGDWFKADFKPASYDSRRNDFFKACHIE